MVDVVALTAELLGLESSSGSEGRTVDFVSRWLVARGWNVMVQEVTPGRGNVWASRSGGGVTLSTHLDPTQGLDPLQITANHPAYTSSVYGETLTQWHVYYVDRVDAQAGTVVIHNPDSTPRKDIEIPFEEFQHVFKGVTVNPVR